MYKINHERTRSAVEKIGIALLISGIIHIALSQSFLVSNILLTVLGFACVILSVVEKTDD